MPEKHDVNCYINFALYAVLGRLAEADSLMREEGHRIRRVAAFLAGKRPVRRVPLYRGMLVDPSSPVARDARYTFVSWSEDRDVACWFAATDSVISEPLVAAKPHLRGVVLELAAPRSVIFHHSWAFEWPIASMAAMHPHMGYEGARQIEWSLRTQREVITAPIDLPPAVDVATIERPPTAELDRRLCPPWVVGAPS